jgi:phosphatidylinositol kinase/protein kinase (PI-3  family)
MMTKAMEVCGTQGSFEKTCDITMTVLREEKVSVMAMLEAFVFDPLINWRLLQSRPTQVCFRSCFRMFCYGLFAHFVHIPECNLQMAMSDGTTQLLLWLL